jgi:uncharacterized protein YggE
MMLGFASLAAVYQYGRSIDQTYPARTFSVQGTADLETPQQIGAFTATVTTEGEGEIAPLQKENTDKMNAITQAFKDQGVDEKDLKTENYAVTPRYETVNCAPGSTCPAPKVNGYTVTQSLEVRVRDLDKVGSLLQLATDKGANQVSSLRFVPDEGNSVTDTARTEAFSEARKKAEALAAAGHFRLGRLVTVSEDDGAGQPAPLPYALKESAAPDIQPGTNPGVFTVVLTYEIR